VKKGYEDRVKAVFDRWELRSDVIGKVTADGLARITEGDKVVAEVPTTVLSSPPMYYWTVRKPAWLRKVQELDLAVIPDLTSEECSSALLRLLASPNICSKESVYRQYDHQVMDNSVVLPGSDAAVIRVKETGKGLALSADGNGRYCYLNPRTGAAIAVAEAARNVACSGAQPIALTDCLNLGNPERDDVFYQLKEVVKGIAWACRRLKIPVISGNVSLYNETGGRAIYPTPVIGMLGLMDDARRHCTSGFKSQGDLVFLLGDAEPRLDGSEYLEVAQGVVRGNPAIDLELERRVQQACIEAVKLGVLQSAHDCSDGGLAVALAESAIQGGLGFSGRVPANGRRDAALFGESQSRIVVSLAPEKASKLTELAGKWQVSLTPLGRAGGDRFAIEGCLDLPLSEITRVWRDSLAEYLK
ncbi:MAG: AIR synthase related protein, partial [Chloroflexota bacterium]